MTNSVPLFANVWGASDFVPRTHCGSWDTASLFFSISGDLAIASIYFVIAVENIKMHRQRVSRTPWMWSIFGTFIFACGVTHVFNSLMFFWPAYRLEALMKWVCVFASLPCMVCLPFLREFLKTKGWEKAP